MYFFQWANHGPRRMQKSNLAIGVHPGSGTTVFFSSSEAADACTLAQTSALLGLERPGASLAAGNVARRAEVAPGDFTDVCFIPDATLPDRVAGIVLDYEVQDGRSQFRTLQFLTRFAQLVHKAGKKVILYTNPLDAPTQRLTGVTGWNAPALVEQFDLLSILLWSRNRQGNIAASFASQKSVFGPWRPEKALIVFELEGTNVQDAATVAALMKASGVSTVMLWRDYARQGGDCGRPVNQKIACLAFGRCE